MSMHSDRTLDEIKARIDIVSLVSDHVSLKKAGRNWKGLCPFHAEKTPSFTVNPDRQIFHCFGCGAGGDIFGFAMKHEHLSFPEALTMLARRAGVELKKNDRADQGLKEPLREINREALRFYRDTLTKTKDASAYIEKRGVLAESVASFELGYAPAQWRALIDHLRAKKYQEAHILQAGLIVAGEKGAYDIFRSRIMFPIFDTQSEVCAFGGRVMDASQPKYLNSPETPIFKKGDTLYALTHARESIRKQGFAMLVEGYLDAIMCHQGGFTNTVAPLGTALTPGHIRKLGRLCEEVLLVFDGDDAGINAAKRSLALALTNGMKVKALGLPKGEDPDSIIKKEGAERFAQLIKSAQGPADFMLSNTGTDKSAAIREMLGIISQIEDPLMRDSVIGELADRAHVREASVREELERMRKPGGAALVRKKGDIYDEEILLLSAVLHMPALMEKVKSELIHDKLHNPLVSEVFGRLHSLASGMTSRAIIESAGTEEEKTLLSRLMVEPGIDAESDECVRQTVTDCIRMIKKRKTDEDIRRVVDEIKKAEKAGDDTTELARKRQGMLQSAI